MFYQVTTVPIPTAISLARKLGNHETFVVTVVRNRTTV